MEGIGCCSEFLKSGCEIRVTQKRVKRVRLHCDNAAVVYSVRSMVCSSKVVMMERRVLKWLLRVLEVNVEKRWLPSAGKIHTDRISRK